MESMLRGNCGRLGLHSRMSGHKEAWTQLLMEGGFLLAWQEPQGRYSGKTTLGECNFLE